jgi:hypothetical protein
MAYRVISHWISSNQMFSYLRAVLMRILLLVRLVWNVLIFLALLLPVGQVWVRWSVWLVFLGIWCWMPRNFIDAHKWGLTVTEPICKKRTLAGQLSVKNIQNFMIWDTRFFSRWYFVVDRRTGMVSKYVVLFLLRKERLISVASMWPTDCKHCWSSSLTSWCSFTAFRRRPS